MSDHMTKMYDEAMAYAYEYGKSNGDGTFSVVIERGEPRQPVPDWPVKPLYAARSTVPEAGKAVVKPLEWQEQDGSFICRAWDYRITTHDSKWGLSPIDWPAFDMPYASAEEAKAAAQADYEQRILSALASVPAPSGAEPVAFIVERLDGTKRYVALAGAGDPRHSSYWVDEERRAEHRVTPLYAAPQAVPAEDVAGLVKRLNAATMRTDWNNLPDDACIPAVPLLREACAALTSLSADKAKLVEWAALIDERATTSEAEATSLRRWLGELLAVIHRDGGHYQEFAGTEQAIVDAQSAVVLLFQAQDDRNDLRRKLEEAIRDRDEKIARALNQADIEAERAGNALNDLETAERKLEEHRTALEPFGTAANHFDQYDAANGETVLVNLSLNDLRRARTLSGASE